MADIVVFRCRGLGSMLTPGRFSTREDLSSACLMESHTIEDVNIKRVLQLWCRIAFQILWIAIYLCSMFALPCNSWPYPKGAARTCRFDQMLAGCFSAGAFMHQPMR